MSWVASAPCGQKRFHANEREKVRVWRAGEKERGGGGGDAGAQALTHPPSWPKIAAARAPRRPPGFPSPSARAQGAAGGCFP